MSRQKGPPMTDDLEQRLREARPICNHSANAGLCHEAADEIARLRAENERLRAGLRMAILGMTCRNGDAHYCPNCDNTTFAAREAAGEALKGSRHE